MGNTVQQCPVQGGPVGTGLAARDDLSDLAGRSVFYANSAVSHRDGDLGVG